MAQRELVKDRILGGSYYNTESFQNVIFSTILSLYDFFEEELFPDDATRIVYASPEFAFRRRIQTQKMTDTNRLTANSLNLPFFSFSIKSGGISPDVDREWKNFPLELEGVMNWDTNQKLKLSPIKIDFDGIFYSDKTMDIHYIMSKFLWIKALETKITPQLEIDGKEFDNIGVVNFDVSFNDTYNESDWLEKNRIQTVNIDFSVDTFLVLGNTSRFCIPQKVIFNFANKHELEDNNFDITLEGVIDHITGEVTF